MKKKLEEAYLPDKDSRRKRVAVGLSGGLHSFVTAYLLKIQKYDLVGVTVAIGWESSNNSAFSCQIDQSRMNAISDFCQMLGIAHIIIKAQDDFKELVMEDWMASKLTGFSISPCWDCHDLRMRLIYLKAKELQISQIATGHFAKLFKNEAHKTVYVHTGNDEVNDQSALLARLPHEILETMLLPLSDLQEKEVLKLAENFGVNEVDGRTKMHKCLTDKAAVVEYLEAHASKNFLSKGEIQNSEGENLGDHLGVHHYKISDDVVGTENNRSGLVFTKYNMSEKKILVDHPDYFKKTKILLTECKVAEETPWHEVMKGVTKGAGGEYLECWIHPKNISSALVEFETPGVFYEGDILTILRKSGKNAKVYLSGKIRYIEEKVIEEGTESAQNKINYGHDF